MKGASYRPDSRKRQRLDDREGTHHKRARTDASGKQQFRRFTTDQNSPVIRPRVTSSQNKDEDDDDDDDQTPDTDSVQPNASKKRSKKERKTNPSTRIHSLRKLLDADKDRSRRGGREGTKAETGHRLPPRVRQEKERELAALLMEQQRQKVRQQTRQNLERYHYVRFVEQQKAERRLKQLWKRHECVSRALKDTGSGVKSDGKSEKRKESKKEKKQDPNHQEGKEKELVALSHSIHEMQINKLYAIYAPLGQKYISVFARDPSRSEKKMNKENNPSTMKPHDFALLSAEQKDELRSTTHEAAGILETVDNNVEASGTKPPMWLNVERLVQKYVRDGELDGSAAVADGAQEREKKQTEIVVGGELKKMLEALRDGKVKTSTITSGGADAIELAQRGSKPPTTIHPLPPAAVAAVAVASNSRSGAAPTWLTDNGVIDPADLDAEVDTDTNSSDKSDERDHMDGSGSGSGGDGDVKNRHGTRDENDDEDEGEDEDMSDGGFFER